MIDASIPLQVKQYQQPDRMNMMAQIMGIRSAQNQNELATYGLNKAKRQDEQSNALMQALHDGLDISTPEGQTKALSIAPEAAQTFIKARLENQNTQAQIGERNANAGMHKVDAATKTIAQHRDQLANVNNPQVAVQWLQAQYQDPTVGPILSKTMPFEAAVQSIPQDPQGFMQWRQQQALGMTKYLEMNKPTTTVVNAGGTSQVLQTPGLGGAPQAVQTVPHTQSPDSVASNARIASEGALNRGQAKTLHDDTIRKDYNVAGLNPDGTPRQMPVAVDGSLDLTKVAPEDLAAAHRYRADGTLPPNMGRGAQGAAESKRIRAIATALDTQAGESPEDARIRQLALKGDVNAVAAMRKREVAVGANVKNFDFNADQVLELSHKVDRTGVPIINAWVNAGRRSVTGNPELAAFDTAVKTTVNEFAQIVSGTTSGASTEGEKKKAEALLNAQQTPEQIISVINQMRIESKNRMQSFTSQRKESMPTNGPRPAAPVATPAAPAAAKGWTYIGPVK